MGLKKLTSKNRVTSIQKMKIFFQFLLRTVKKNLRNCFVHWLFYQSKLCQKRIASEIWLQPS